MEGKEAGRLFLEKLSSAEKILVGIGSEWKRKPQEEERKVKKAAAQLNRLLEGRDYYILTSLSGEDASRLGFEKNHMAVPFDVSFREEEWKAYTEWLSRTMNRETLVAELGEGFQTPSLMRWPFEKAVFLNRKAYLFRVHHTFSQIPENIKEKAAAVSEDSIDFLLTELGKEYGGYDGSNSK